MFQNYFTVAIRNIIRNKRFAFLNILGLAIGIVSCLLIYIFIQDELSFDAHHAKRDNIYRVQCFFKFNDVEDKFGIVPFPAGPTLQSEYPEVKEMARLYELGQQNFTNEGKVYNVQAIHLADSTFFNIFDFPFIAGNPKTALSEPMSLVITQGEARKVFGTADPMGKMVTWNKKTLKVTGVIDEKKYNTHIEMGGFISMSSMNPDFKKQLATNWGNNNSFTYIVMNDENAAASFQPKLDALVKKYMDPFWSASGFNGKITMHIEPLKDIRFNNYLIYDTPKKGNRAYVTIFSVVAILILLIACINYVNMSTAAATRRAKEVGVRKVAGAGRGQLIFQFLSESVIVTLLAIIISLALLELSLPLFNELTGKEITLKYLLQGSFIAVLLSIIILVGIIAGSYPAFFLSNFKPQVVLKGFGEVKGGGAGIRKVLITGQFAISVFMIAGTMAVYSQLHYMLNKDLGFNQDNMLVVSIPPTGPDSLAVKKIRNLKDELKKESYVKDATFSNNIPGKDLSRIVYQVKTNKGKEDKPIATMQGDANYPKMMGMQLTKGRYFEEGNPTDRDFGCMINESCAKMLGWTDPLKEKFIFPGDSADIEIHVIGVVKDFHFASLHSPIEPLVIFMNDSRFASGSMLINLHNGDIQQSIDKIKTKWQQVIPNKEFEYYFLDDSMHELYQAENKMLRVFIYFAILTVILSCMGIYGLSYFITRRRTREIGIRKVLGASVSSILFLLNKEFLILVGVASVIAIPLSYWAINNWLMDFAYHTGISVLLFIAAVLITTLVAVVTISIQALRTATGNPVNSIRYE
jgi:putative ABC transport system permease protein